MNKDQKPSAFFPRGKYYLEIDVQTDTAQSVIEIMRLIRDQNDLFPGIKVSQLFFGGTDIEMIAKIKADSFISQFKKELDDNIHNLNFTLIK